VNTSTSLCNWINLTNQGLFLTAASCLHGHIYFCPQHLPRIFISFCASLNWQFNTDQEFHSFSRLFWWNISVRPHAVQLVILQVLDSFISVHHNVGLKVLFLFVCAEIVYMDKRLYSPCFLSQCYCAFNSLVHISSYFYKMRRKYKYLYQTCIHFWPTHPFTRVTGDINNVCAGFRRTCDEYTAHLLLSAPLSF